MARNEATITFFYKTFNLFQTGFFSFDNVDWLKGIFASRLRLGAGYGNTSGT